MQTAPTIPAMTRVFCSGNLVADVQAKTLTQLPPTDEVAIVDEIELILGGNAANAALVLGWLGIDTAVIGRIGGDYFGDFVQAVLADARIDTEMLVVDPTAKTAATIAAIDPLGKRRCAHVPAATANFTAADFDWSQIRHNLDLRQANEQLFLHFSSFFLLPGFDGASTAAVLQQAQQLGLHTSLDVCWDATGRWAMELIPALPHCDLIFPNETEARAITGESDPVAMAQWFLDRGVKTAVIKLGADGCVVKNEEFTVKVPGFAVQAVDATGAGDAFAGAFLAGLVRQWDWERTARFACALAALSVTGFGVTSALRSEEQVLALMDGSLV